MRIIVDLDSTVADLNTPWLKAYNKEYGDNLTVEQITDFEMENFVKPECGTDIYRYLTPALFGSLEPFPGSIVAVTKLMANHEVKFVTAAPFGTADAKISWVSRWFGISKKEIVTCHHKYMIKADVLIDDSPHNIRDYRKHWPSALIATIAWPHNLSVKEHTDVYAESWKEPAKAWEEIYERICEHA